MGKWKSVFKINKQTIRRDGEIKKKLKNEKRNGEKKIAFILEKMETFI
jgi:hypothetical protein